MIFTSTQSFMLVLDNLQIEMNILQNYVEKYTVLLDVLFLR